MRTRRPAGENTDNMDKGKPSSPRAALNDSVWLVPEPRVNPAGGISGSHDETGRVLQRAGVKSAALGGNPMESVSAFSLWLPILLSAVFVFVASSIIHMVLGYHKNDYKAVPNEDAALTAIRALNLAPGDYCLPRPASMKDMGTPEFKAKLAKGPTLVMTVFTGGSAGMGPQLVQWFLYAIVASFVTAYITGIAYGPGATYPQIFRLAATAGFACYAMALPQQSIWYKHSWATTAKNVIDGFIYGCLMGGTFGWLWPR